MPNKVTSQDKRDQVLELHAAGMSRNDIARETGVAAGTVTKIVHEAGGSFDRSSTVAATEARRLDARKMRSQIALDLLDDAARLRRQLWQPHTYIDHGGRDFTEARWTQDEPSPVDKLKLMQAASTALGRHMDLDRHDAEDAAADAKSMLGQLGELLGVKRPDDNA